MRAARRPRIVMGEHWTCLCLLRGRGIMLSDAMPPAHLWRYSPVSSNKHTARSRFASPPLTVLGAVEDEEDPRVK
ncbi:hypothetical protein E2C01_097110 [Portunus trituberculatus]|uniref:Uncharacterized protein n=1 Tax=Portunus trituberculatus TaxID=210409 RepID=A0A5B7K3R9_PORTR|nr:hypothetical protein [Portunus trituberculatus]